MPIDQMVTDFVVQNLRADWLTPVMVAFSDLVTAPSVILITLVLAALVPGRRIVPLCLLNMTGAMLLNQALKFIVQRPRPDVALRLVDIGGYSFPSGHSMAAMAFFGLLIWMIWRSVKDPCRRALLCAALGIIIALVGFSRIYLGVHYLTDVLAGFAISFLWLVLYTKFVVPRLLKSLPAARQTP